MIRLLYLGNKGNKGKELVKTCTCNLKRCVQTNNKFVTLYDFDAQFFALQKIRSILIRNSFPAGNCMFKVKIKKKLEHGVFIVNFEHISHFFLVFLLLALSKQIPAEL